MLEFAKIPGPAVRKAPRADRTAADNESALAVRIRALYIWLSPARFGNF